MPFKPRIIRFDDEHTSVPGPLGGSSGAPLATATDNALPLETSPLETPLQDPTHDTVRGLEFETIRNLDVDNWDVDDALLSDPKLQCLARQLSDDAAALAKRYPADGWEPPAMEALPVSEPVEPRRSRILAIFTGHVAWRRWLGLGVAAAVCLAVAIGPRSTHHANPTKFEPAAGTEPAAADPLFVVAPPRQLHFEDGDTAIWGPDLVDDSQFGESPFGFDAIENSPNKVLSAPGHDALRELLPADSHDYCEVSM